MLNYGYLLKSKEKDNPSNFCRNSYLFGNVGDLVYCYGRILRFPKDEKIYLAEIKLALGDILMQCRMKEYELKVKPMNDFRSGRLGKGWIEYYIKTIANEAGIIINAKRKKTEIRSTQHIIFCANDMCKLLGWKPEDIEHLGYQHVMERFEQFREDGWK